MIIWYTSWCSLLIPDLIPLADEALLVLFAHMLEELVVAKHTFTTELAQRMRLAFDLIFFPVGYAIASLEVR